MRRPSTKWHKKNKLPLELIRELVLAIPLKKVYESRGLVSSAFDSYFMVRRRKLQQLLLNQNELLKEIIQIQDELISFLNQIIDLQQELITRLKKQTATEYLHDQYSEDIAASIETSRKNIDDITKRLDESKQKSDKYSRALTAITGPRARKRSAENGNAIFDKKSKF